MGNDCVKDRDSIDDDADVDDDFDDSVVSIFSSVIDDDDAAVGSITDCD